MQFWPRFKEILMDSNLQKCLQMKQVILKSGYEKEKNTFFR
jgi:hypothetical protein